MMGTTSKDDPYEQWNPPARRTCDEMIRVKVGDIVEVHQIVALGPDRWIPAQVVSVWSGGFSVKSMREPFDDDGHDLMSLPENGNAQNPAIWR